MNIVNSVVRGIAAASVLSWSATASAVIVNPFDPFADGNGQIIAVSGSNSDDSFAAVEGGVRHVEVFSGGGHIVSVETGPAGLFILDADGSGNVQLNYDGAFGTEAYGPGIGPENLTAQGFNQFYVGLNSSTIAEQIEIRLFDGTGSPGASNFVNGLINIPASGASTLTFDFSNLVQQGSSSVADTLDSVGRIELFMDFTGNWDLSLTEVGFSAAAVPAPAGAALMGFIALGLFSRTKRRQ